LEQACVKGHHFRACYDEDGAFSHYSLENGKELTGTAVLGYCYGQTDGSISGSCRGPSGSDCVYRYFEPTSCEAEPSCNWEDP
jgi:hypothetical protein